MSKKSPSSNVNQNSEDREGVETATAQSLTVKQLSPNKAARGRFKCSSSENNIKGAGAAVGGSRKGGIKQKIVSKVRSWSSRDKYALDESIELETNLAQTLNQAGQAQDSEDCESVADSNLSRAKDSLENLLKDEQNIPNDEWRSKSCPSTSKNSPESPKSSPVLHPGGAKTGRSIFWDPFEKKTRKNRDTNRKKKKYHVEPPKKETNSMPMEGKSCLTKKEEKPEETAANDTDTIEEEFPYKYKYFPKNSKSVVFTQEVFVVYFNGEEVVYESKEPLKKDEEQQERNKEMRQGHIFKARDNKYNLCLY
nr:unnamed protein product [Callosobruchus analis]